MCLRFAGKLRSPFLQKQLPQPETPPSTDLPHSAAAFQPGKGVCEEPVPGVPPCAVQAEEEAVYEEPPQQDTFYEEPPVVGALHWGQGCEGPPLHGHGGARSCLKLEQAACVMLSIKHHCAGGDPCPRHALSPAKATRTPDLLPTLGQVLQQDAGAEHADGYLGLTGKGLCARALYDYQAGRWGTTGHPRLQACSQADSGASTAGWREDRREQGGGTTGDLAGSLGSIWCACCCSAGPGAHP